MTDAPSDALTTCRMQSTDLTLSVIQFNGGAFSLMSSLGLRIKLLFTDMELRRVEMLCNI